MATKRRSTRVVITKLDEPKAIPVKVKRSVFVVVAAGLALLTVYHHGDILRKVVITGVSWASQQLF